MLCLLFAFASILLSGPDPEIGSSQFQTDKPFGS